MKKMNKKGFTIVELVIVIAVIAILAAVMIPTFGGIIKKANESSAKQTAAALYKQAIALDLADGVQDGYEGTPNDDATKGPVTKITTIEGKTVTYTVDTTKTPIEVTFSYKNEKNVTATTNNGSDWTVTGLN